MLVRKVRRYPSMIHQGRTQRFGIHASVIQLLTLTAATGFRDGGIMAAACTLASLVFWILAAALLWRREEHVSRPRLFFLRWGLIVFVVIGTPLLRPALLSWEWFPPLLYPALAVLIVMPLMYLITRALGLPSPFEGTPPGSDRPVARRMDSSDGDCSSHKP